MQNMKVVYELPVGGAGCGDIATNFTGGDLYLRYEFGSSKAPKVGCVIFENVIAFRYRNEYHSAGFLDGSYDAVVCLDSSSWLEELFRIEKADDYFTVRKCSHFAVYLSSNGFLEVVCQSFSVGEDEDGDLQTEET